MKKTEGNIRPLFFENLKTDFEKVQKIKERFMYDTSFIQFYKSK